MGQVHCIIIDDEPLSREVLRKYISQVKELTMLCECSDAMEAIGYLAKNRVDLLFLDIRMPGLSGISFARSLTSAPLIIFTTAYPQYAVEGFELNAVDYLVKPYSFERFLLAVNRGMQLLSQRTGSEPASRKIIMKADKKIYAVDPEEILYLEGQGDYIRVVMRDKKLVIHGTIKNLVESLPGEDFMRIHRSYAVNLKHIAFIEGNQVRIGEHVIPVSPALREELLSRFSLP
jgi:two-component system LytT family response regulator